MHAVDVHPPVVFTPLLPPVAWPTLHMSQVDRLGDAKPQVRDAAAGALQTILQTWDLSQALSKLHSIWTHRSPKVKQGAMQAVTQAIAAQPIAIALPGNWDQLVLKPAAQLLDDANR